MEGEIAVEKDTENRKDNNNAEEQVETLELPILPVDDLVIFPYMPPVPPFQRNPVALTGKVAMDAIEDAILNTDKELCIFQTTSGRSLDTDPRAVKT